MKEQHLAPAAESNGRAYAIAVAAVAVGIISRMLLTGFLAPDLLNLPLFCAVVVASLWGGTRSGIAAATLSALAMVILSSPVGLPWFDSAQEGLGAAVFILMSLVVVAFCDHVLRTKRRLEVTDILFRAFMDNSPAGSWMRDGDGKYVFVNKALERATGKPLHEWLGKDDLEIFPKELAEARQAAVERVAQTRSPDQTLERWEFNGTTRHFLVQRFPVVQADGRIGVGGKAIDVTDRVEAEAHLEAALRRQEESRLLLDTLVSAAPIGIAVIDREMRFTLVNEPLAQMNGIPVAEHIGRKVADVVPSLEHQVKPFFDQVIQTGAPIVGQEVTGTTKKAPGETRYWLENWYPVRDAAGEITAVGIIVLEITDRKLAEKERERLLEGERAARSEAERLNRLKDEFLATLSHELRTPLNAILGWAQLIERRGFRKEDVEQGLTVINRNAKAQNELIDDLLDMSRIISGKLRLEVRPVDPKEVIEAALNSVLPAAEAKELRIERILDPDAGPISGDSARLQQVVWNLLTNAVKFTPKGGRIQLLLRRSDSEVEISVSDTGQGISKEFLPFVFDRFRQADSSTARRHGGLGVGLSLVKQLTELHGGNVKVTSPGEGKGTTFTVILPVSIAQSHIDQSMPAVRNRLEQVRLADDQNLDLSGVRVLFVDDEPDARTIGQRILEDRGATVITAGSAAEALDRLSSDHPDVLVSDIGMPAVDGYELIRQVRMLSPDAGGRIPAAALTAFARSEDRRKALLAGYQSHIAKPVDPTELVTIVASLSGRISASIGGSSPEPVGH